MPALLSPARMEPAQRDAIAELATRLVAGLRGKQAGLARENRVQGLLQEFSLSSQEGVALMCLAEALLRIPDAGTRDALIRDKIGQGDWRAAPRAEPVAVRECRRHGACCVTGKLVATHERGGARRRRSRASPRARRRAA